MRATIKDFLKLESAGGIALMAAAVLAMLVANSPLKPWYDLLLEVPVEVRVGALHIAKPLILWINDGLMAVFFFLIGLELKREIVEGELSEPSNLILPLMGAVGGIALPVTIYVLFNSGSESAMKGWAIPAATDIAFALGLLMLLGSRVPPALKVLLVSLAIFDDLAAIVIIAIFYTSKLSLTAMVITALCLLVLFVMSRRGVMSISAYVCVGVIMWVAVLKSGVHATLAGVALAAFIPMRDPAEPQRSPLAELEHDLHGLVAFAILPLFAFVNAGLSFAGVGYEDITHSVPLGIAVALFVGKSIGVFLLCWLTIVSGAARMPQGGNWGSLFGVATLCGVGFTMSLFVGSLAFEDSGATIEAVFDVRLGIIMGSLLSGMVGYFVLHRALPAATMGRT